MDVNETFDNFAKQLPHASGILKETGINAVTQCASLAEFHLSSNMHHRLKVRVNLLQSSPV